jgi:hypothetical protein
MRVGEAVLVGVGVLDAVADGRSVHVGRGVCVMVLVWLATRVGRLVKVTCGATFAAVGSGGGFWKKSTVTLIKKIAAKPMITNNETTRGERTGEVESIFCVLFQGCLILHQDGLLLVKAQVCQGWLYLPIWKAV